MGKYNSTVPYEEAPTANIIRGTSAEFAYHLYLSKLEQINNLKYECNLLIDKYHEEMCKSSIPSWFGEGTIEYLFSDDKKTRKYARENFLKLCFSEEFLKKHTVTFTSLSWQGYQRTAVSIGMSIGDYIYFVEIPLPSNITSEDAKNDLMGKVMFRADRIHKKKRNEFLQEYDNVMMPTYNWKACFAAIEEDVDKCFSK